jgi:ADP-ribosylglycohydrolase
MRSSFEGAMLGLAVGDALGFPRELVERPPAVVDFVARTHPAGSVSDDTQMTIAVAEALLARGGGDLDPLMEDLAARFVAWSRSPDNDRAPGRACLAGCAALERGVPWRQAGNPDSKGCGTAMRVAPIGLRYHRDRRRLLEVARASALPTHGHPAAIEGAAAAALMIALALDKRSPEDILDALVTECGSRSPDLDARLRQVPELLAAGPDFALSRAGLGDGWIAEEAVACALWCFWRSPSDYRATVLVGANSGGDCDSIACIAGGLSGAYNGVDAIPRAWRDGVEHAARLRELAAGLWAQAAG